MIAGTLARIRPTADEPLEGFARSGGFPALEVTRTQTTVTDATPQSATVAGRIETSETVVDAGTDQDGDPWIQTDRVEGLDRIATDVYADVTGAGIALAESIASDEELPFPFDVLSAAVGTTFVRQQIDVRALFERWDDDGDLSDVWMAGSDEHGSAMAYHGQATEVEPTIGIGFKRAWGSTTIKGVVWEGGYVALHNARHAADGLKFVADEIVPDASAWDPDEQQDQTDFDEFGGGA